LRQSAHRENKNCGIFATFLRLGAHFRPHKAKTGRHETDLPALSHLNPWLESSEQSLIAKKLQKSRDFCFRDGRITATGRICWKTRKVSNGNEGKCLKRRRGYDNSRANTAKRNKRKRQLGIAAAFCSGCIYANYGQDYRINGKGFAVFR